SAKENSQKIAFLEPAHKTHKESREPHRGDKYEQQINLIKNHQTYAGKQQSGIGQKRVKITFQDFPRKHIKPQRSQKEIKQYKNNICLVVRKPYKSSNPYQKYKRAQHPPVNKRQKRTACIRERLP
ncbi:MAG: hypothetical protein KA403_04905, partial [Candidatus Omnitrophica bacterium]|nr:hypothetical protein [Candidatus Omnitrophota bacterium]